MSTLKSIFRPLYRHIKGKIQLRHINNETDKLSHISNDKKYPKIFYFGIPEHSNLGDLAQYYCIRKWLNENYPSIEVHEFESTTVVSSHFNFTKRLSEILNPDDIIFFQSGYTTQDLGGNHELMHRIIIEAFPNANVVIMPQTIFFKSEERKRLTSKCYNQNKNLLFLARDRISYEMACEMFPDVTVKHYPDIVTSLIGHYDYNYERNKALFICRNDSEKYYSDEEIKSLRQKIGCLLPTDMTDTTIRTHYKKARKNLKDCIEREFDKYAHYRLVITDRYHGVIFSLATNTPVIALKTNDHKVTTGAEWLHEIYNDYIFLAESLEHACWLAKEILKNEYTYRLEPHLDREYYKKLKNIIDEKYMGTKKGV